MKMKNNATTTNAGTVLKSLENLILREDSDFNDFITIAEDNTCLESDWSTLLIMAVRSRRDDIITYLVEAQSANINFKDTDGNTAFDYVERDYQFHELFNDNGGIKRSILQVFPGNEDKKQCFEGSNDFYFKKAQENVNYICDDGVTLLMCAVLYKRYDVIQYLIEKGVDVEGKCENGNTAYDCLMNTYQRDDVLSEGKVRPCILDLLPVNVCRTKFENFVLSYKRPQSYVNSEHYNSCRLNGDKLIDIFTSYNLSLSPDTDFVSSNESYGNDPDIDNTLIYLAPVLALNICCMYMFVIWGLSEFSMSFKLFLLAHRFTLLVTAPAVILGLSCFIMILYNLCNNNVSPGIRGSKNENPISSEILNDTAPLTSDSPSRERSSTISSDVSNPSRDNP
jgi:ankyrin repeat protein